MNVLSTRRTRRFGLAVGALSVIGLGLHTLPDVEAQTTTTAPPSALLVSLNPLLANGITRNNMPTGPQTLTVTIQNLGTVALTSLQAVVKVPASPALVISVSDASGSVGLIDSRTGSWYHTITTVPAGGQVSLNVSWAMPCSGRWPVAVRVSDSLSSFIGTWVGTPNPQCGLDESVSPAPPSYFQLPWPPTANTGPTTTSSPAAASTTVAGSPTTLQPIVVPPPGPSTVVPAGATTTALIQPQGTTTVPLLARPIAGAVAPTLAPGVSSTVPAAVPTAAVPLPSSALPTFPVATATVPGATGPRPIPTTTTLKRAPSSGPTTTVVVLCKTIGGKRYCAPKSSVYKAGQKKAVETKPRKSATRSK